jgi:cytochrome c oxidase subunit 2
MLGWFPHSISTYGADVDGVFATIYYVVGFWFVLTEAVLLYFVLRYRRRAGRPATYVRGTAWHELAWLLVPAAIVLMLDLGIDAVGAPVWARVKERTPAGGVEVQVTARQFNWDVVYPGPDGRFDTADDLKLENQLHVPAGQNVHLILRSSDVIHSFFLPNVRLKQDVLPGRTIRAWFDATEPGEYEIACAELCGFGHYTMRGLLTVHTPEDYRQWVAAQWPGQAGGADSAGHSAAPERRAG